MPTNPKSLDDSFSLTEEKSEDFEVSSSSHFNTKQNGSSPKRDNNNNNNNSIKDFDTSYNFTNLPREELLGSSSRMRYGPSGVTSPQPPPKQQQQPRSQPPLQQPQQDQDQQEPQFIPHGKLPFRGRHGELTSLDKAMERISLEWMENPSEVVWVSGPRGVGKTTLVDQATTREAFAKAMVCRGLCEQHSTAAQPFNALSECLSHLCSQLMKNGQKAIWKHRLEEALGGEGPLVCTICPPLSQLLECAPLERRLLMAFDNNSLQRLNRLAFAVRDLLQAVSEVHPLCMIVDNIHFADADSLKLMEELLSTKPLQNFLLIGIYDTKVTSLPLTKMRDFLKKDDSTTTSDIRLQGFTNEELKDVITQLFWDNNLADTSGDAIEIADIAFAITKGNPLWVVQLLKLWQEHKLITLENNSTTKWECNRKKIKKEVKQWKDDGLECYTSCEGVIQARIKLLPKKIQFVVIILAKLKLTHFRIDDNQFYRVLVAANYRKAAKTDKDPISSQGELEKMIQKACQYGILQKRNRPGWFKFLNDVVRQCAASLPSPYEMIAKKAKPNEVSKLDLYIGTELSHMASEPGNTSPEQRDRYKILGVEALANGVAGMEVAEKARFAKLNLEAAEIAISKTAFQSAIVYLERAVKVVDPRSRWQPDQYDVTLRIFLFLARMRLCCGRHKESKAACDEIFDNCTTIKDRVYANQVHVLQLQQEGKYDEALERLLAVLKKVGESFPEKDVESVIERDFGKLSKKLAAVQNQQLLNPKKVTDKKAMDTMMILAHLIEVSRFASPNRYVELATLRMVKISLDIGFTRQYPLAFALMGVLLVERGQVKEAHRLGQVAEKIARLTDFYGGEAVALFHWHISHWRRPYKRILEPVLRIYNAQVDSGDFCHVGFSIHTYVQYHLVSGFDIEKLSDNVQLFQGLYLDFNLNDEWFIEISQQAVSNLLGESSYPLVLFGVTLEQQEEKLDEYRENGWHRALEYFYLIRLYMAFFFQDFEVMEECFEKLPDPVQGVWIPWIDFMHCFLLIQYLPESKGKARKDLKEKIELFRNRLTECYNEGNPNVNAMTAILDAEWVIAKEAGRGLSAMRAQEIYKVAVDTATQDAVVHLEAFACERAGRHFNMTGVEGFSSEYFIRSHKAYDRCHYVAKVIDLEHNFASLLKITNKRRARPGTAYIEHNAALRPSNKEIGGGQHQAKTVNLVKGIKKTAKKIKGVKNTSRKVKELFKKEKAEPAPWGWNSKNKMALEDDEEAIPGISPKSPRKSLSTRLLGKGKKMDGDHDKELSPGLPMSPSPTQKPRASVAGRLLGRSKKQMEATETDEAELSPTVGSASPSPKPRVNSLFGRRGGKKKGGEDAVDVGVEESPPSPTPSKSSKGGASQRRSVPPPKSTRDKAREDDVDVGVEDSPPSPSSKSPKGRGSQKRSVAPPKSARDQQPVEAIDDMLESPKPRASRTLDMDAGPMNIPFGIDSDDEEEGVPKKKEPKSKKPSRREKAKGNV